MSVGKQVNGFYDTWGFEVWMYKFTLQFLHDVSVCVYYVFSKWWIDFIGIVQGGCNVNRIVKACGT